MNTTSAAATDLTGRRFNYRKIGAWFIGIGIWLLPIIWMDLVIYLDLTIAGLTMGCLLFLTASGLSLIFGLVDVLNLAHGAFFAWGAYIGYSLLLILDRMGWVMTATWTQSVASLVIALAVAALIGAVLGIILERLIIRQVYGNHLKQILVTMGVSVIMVELIKIFWGPNNEVMPVPSVFLDYWYIGGIMINKFRGLSIIVGAGVFAVILLVLKKTKLGIIVRAGVENREIVQAMGYNIHRVFTGVFAAGAALAAIGGAMFAMFNEQIHPYMGDHMLVFALIIVIIGGLGSVTGSFLGALMVGLAFNYAAFLLPKLALGVNVLIMAIVLLLRPTGLMDHD